MDLLSRAQAEITRVEEQELTAKTLQFSKLFQKIGVLPEEYIIVRSGSIIQARLLDFYNLHFTIEEDEFYEDVLVAHYWWDTTGYISVSINSLYELGKVLDRLVPKKRVW